MAKLKNLEDFRDEIAQCVKCGACRAHCPAFGAEKYEGRVARGKIALADALLKGDVDLEDRFLLDMSQCLLCGSCTAQCPNNVHTEEIVAAVRREITRRKGLPTFGKGVAAVLKNQGALNLLAKGGGVFSSLLFKKIPEQSGLRLRFPAPMIHSDRTLPPLTVNPLRERHPEIIPGAAGKPTVLFFTGCGINYLYPAAGDALIEALKHIGVTVLIPKDQVCCGMPAVSAGAKETVESLAERNLSVFSALQYDYIVTACASCHSGLKQIYPSMGGAFAAVRDDVRDILVFLVEQGFAQKLAELPKADPPVRVTYHDPCHLRSREAGRASRAILKSLPQIAFTEMEAAATCCGLGGTYSAYHYDTSKKIGAKKARFIADSGADLVATDCPGCILQLQDSINHAGGKQRAVHILDLVAAALQ